MASGVSCRRQEMKNINSEKLWAYLDAKFSELGEEYERQFERARAAKSDEMTAIISRMTAANEKRNFIIELRNEILSGSLDA